MGNELLLQQQAKKGSTVPDIETEIECPRCYDMMVLSSDFDKLLYFCEGCNLSLSIFKFRMIYMVFINSKADFSPNCFHKNDNS
jgi:hypothetical protein